MKPDSLEVLKNGGVGVIPTDTVYGLACSAFSETALRRMFEIKGRADNKPPVVLIADFSDLNKLGAELVGRAKILAEKFWPGPVSLIIPIKSDLKYLDQGLGLAIRLPADENLRNILRQTGPLATTSANLQNQPPARNLDEAKRYFRNKVDFYEDGGELCQTASTLVRVNGDKVDVLRQGDVKVS